MLKRVILRCEDLTLSQDGLVSLLEGAKTAHLQQLAQAGTAGLLRPQTWRQAFDRAQIHRGLVGLKEDDLEAQVGRWYAAAAGISAEPDEMIWCCDFITQQDGRVADPTTSALTTKEAQILLQALDEQLGSDVRHWEVGDGFRHLLMVKEAAFSGKSPRLESSDTLAGEDWRRRLPRNAAGEAIMALIEQASGILENHSVNRVRLDLNENPANCIWLWGGASAQAKGSFSSAAGGEGTIFSSDFLLRGLSRSYGLGCQPVPQNLDEAGFQQLAHAALQTLEKQPFLYIHVQVRTADPVERLCAMERLDQHLLKPLSQAVSRGNGRMAVVVDSRDAGRIPFVAIGDGLAHKPVADLSVEKLQENALSFADAAELFAWLGKAEK